MKIDVEKLKMITDGIHKIIKQATPKEKAETEIAGMKEFQNFRDSLDRESDRGSVLMAAAYIEDKIGNLIESFLVDNKKVRERMMKGNGSLATFSSKIDMAFLLGLLPEDILNDLHKLRKTRNEFAHNPSMISFETGSIKDRVLSLEVVNKVLLRDNTRAYFLRSMTTILTFINMKMESFERCTVSESFDIAALEQTLKFIHDQVVKEEAKVD